MKFRLFSFALVLALLAGRRAEAASYSSYSYSNNPNKYAVTATLLGLVNNTTPKGSENPLDTGVTFGWGMLLEFRLYGGLGAEMGIIRMHRRYGLINSQTTTTTELTLTRIPMLLRLHFAKVLSIGGGIYLATYSSEVGREITTGNNTVASALTIKNAGIARHDYGFEGSAALHTPLSKRTKLTLDGRYIMGLKNNDITGFGILKFRDLQLLAGVSVSF